MPQVLTLSVAAQQVSIDLENVGHSKTAGRTAGPESHQSHPLVDHLTTVLLTKTRLSESAAVEMLEVR